MSHASHTAAGHLGQPTMGSPLRSTQNLHGDRPRFALFGRWHHRERESMRFNIAGIAEAEATDGHEAETLWKDWQPDVRRVVASAGAGASGGAAKL